MENQALARVLQRVAEREMFAKLRRFKYAATDEQALQVVEAIGKKRSPGFVLDEENRFAYLNFARWALGSSRMQALNPDTGEIIPGNLNRGIYIAGNTGTGKSWCVEVIREFCLAAGLRVLFSGDSSPRPLSWDNTHSGDITTAFATTGDVQHFKQAHILTIQDLGMEPQESIYMGNRWDVLRSLLEYRGDKCANCLTIITSNLKMGGELLSNRYGNRVSSRLREMCNYFEIKGKDRRKL